MATPKKDLEIFIDGISLSKAVFPGETRRLADFKLLYPRLSIAQKTSSKTIVLVDGAWPKLAQRRWTDTIVFKESVQGNFGIEISVSEPVSEKDLENAAASSAATMLKLFGDLAADAVGIKALGGFMELPASALAKALTGSSYSAKVAASGSIDIPGAAYSLLKEGDETMVAVPILAERDIVKTVRHANKTQAHAASRRTIAKKGTPVGTITLILKAI